MDAHVSVNRSRTISYATGRNRGRIPPLDDPVRAFAPLHSTVSTESIATRHSNHSLFDASDAESLPGNLHVSSSSSIEHLVNRYGAVALIRQLSTDLAHREAEILMSQRKVAQRESVMMRLLSEVGISSSQVEALIRERTAELKDDQEYLKDLINDAMEQKLDDADSPKTESKPSTPEEPMVTLAPKRRTRPHSLSSPAAPISAASSDYHYDIFNAFNAVSHKFLNHIPHPVHDVIITNSTTSRPAPLEMDSFHKSGQLPEHDDYVDQFGFVYGNKSTQTKSSQPAGLVDSSPLKSRLLSLAQNHDMTQQKGSNQWNEFLKRLSLLDNDSHGDLLTINGENIIHYRHLYKELTKLIQMGVPKLVRPKLWSELCGANTLRNPTEYHELLDSAAPNTEAESQIQLDLYRTMPFNVFFKDSGPGLGNLQRVLIAFSRKYPQIGYCQGMNFIVANLLLVYHDDEDVFWVFVGLFENVLPKGFFNLTNIKGDMTILKHNFQEQLPELHSHFTQHDVELEPICFNWFMSLFTDSLSAPIVFRIWDNLMLNGYVEIHKTTLALFKVFEDKLLSMADNIEAYEFMKNLNKSNFNLKGSELIATSCKIKVVM